MSDRIAVCSAAVLCAVLLIISSRWLGAALDLQIVKSLLAQSSSSAYPPDMQEVLQQRATRATRLQPLSADHSAMLAYVLSAETASESGADLRVADSTSTGPEARQLMARALVHRPASGHLWALYAESLAVDSGEMGAARESAARAVSLAPWQWAVLIRDLALFVDLLERRESLSPEETARLSRGLGIIASRSKMQLRKAIGSTARAQLLLPYAKDEVSRAVLETVAD